MIAYAITDPSTLHFTSLEHDLERFAKRANMIVYRDKETMTYAKDAIAFMVEAKRHSFDKILLHRDVALADHVQADGVHLTSNQFDRVIYAKQLGLYVVLSTHNEEEIALAQSLGANAVTFSPIFATPNKGEPKGLELLKAMTTKFTVPIIALGGVVTEEQVTQCQACGARGFASIRYFAQEHG